MYWIRKVVFGQIINTLLTRTVHRTDNEYLIDKKCTSDDVTGNYMKQ